MQHLDNIHIVHDQALNYLSIFHKSFYTKDLYIKDQTKGHYDASVIAHNGPEAGQNSFILSIPIHFLKMNF